MTSTDEILISDLVAPIIRRWRLIALVSLVCAIIGAIIMVLLPPSYRATTSFIPEPPAEGGLAANLGGLAALAGEFGVGSANANTYSPEFAAQVLESDAVLRAALTVKLPDMQTTSRQPRTLLELLDVDTTDSMAKQLEKGVHQLRESTAVDVDQHTGIVSLAVESRSPILAAEVANLLVAKLDSFNIERRQLNSREQRIFTEARVAEAKEELKQAEEAQLRFLTNNRTYTDSPLLRFQANRLEREVQFKQDVYTTLSNAYEEARIAEVRDTPLLTVIDQAVPPTSPSSLSPLLAAFVGLIAGGVLGVVFVFFVASRDAARVARQSESDIAADAVQSPAPNDPVHVAR